MPTLESVNYDALYYMFKGEPGTRKSTAALSFAVLGPQYWFSWDRKMAALGLPMRAWGKSIDPKSIIYDDYEDWNAARTKLESFAVDCKYKSIVVDSITSMADMTLRQTLKLKRGETRKSGQSAGKVIAGIAVNELEDYNAESSAIAELVALTKDINRYHKIPVILIAHVMEVTKMENNKTAVSRTLVTAGKRVAAKLPAYCDEVYHFDIDAGFEEGSGGKYRIITEHTGDDFARTALPIGNKFEVGNRPLYSDFIKPAIEKMKQPSGVF